MELILMFVAGVMFLIWELFTAIWELGEDIARYLSRTTIEKADHRRALAPLARDGKVLHEVLEHAERKREAVAALMANGYTRPEANAVLRDLIRLGKGKK